MTAVVGNPLSAYRQAQRRLRALFAPFTASHCPTCPTPCCRQPTWVRPVDIILVEELGFALPAREGAAGALIDATLGDGPALPGAPCEYLGERGCAFPDDLRPFGCAAMICQYMRRDLPAEELRAIEGAVARLERAHAALMTALHEPA